MYLTNLKQKIENLDKRIAEAEIRLSELKPQEAVKAAGEIASLKLRRNTLIDKFDDSKRHGAENWSALHVELQEDVDSLQEAFEDWFRGVARL